MLSSIVRALVFPSRLSKSSQSLTNPPAPIPNKNLPFDRLSNKAACPATIAGCC